MGAERVEHAGNTRRACGTGLDADRPGAGRPAGPGPTPTDPVAWLAAAAVDAAVFDLRPDYRALLLTAEGLRGGATDAVSNRVLLAAVHPHPDHHRTSNALFILDALGPRSDDDVLAAADALTDALRELGPDVLTHRRLFEHPTRAAERPRPW